MGFLLLVHFWDTISLFETCVHGWEERWESLVSGIIKVANLLAPLETMRGLRTGVLDCSVGSERQWYLEIGGSCDSAIAFERWICDAGSMFLLITFAAG